ncbi:cytochrome P450 [Xylariomycetidae sp. FL2044]|nr:cytochrome P450 [Xylariomycetidae sp. FL2044]
MDYPVVDLLLILGITAAWWYYFRTKSTRATSVANVAYVDLEGEDRTPIRYAAETGNLVARGYAKKYRATDELMQPIEQACLAGFKKDMPPCPEWTSVMPFNLLMSIFVRMGARMLVGPELHDAWVSLSFRYLPVFVKASRSVQTNYRSTTRWLAKYIDADVKSVIKIRREAGEMLRPVIEARSKQLDSADSAGGKHNQDAIQWLLLEHRKKGQRLSPDELAQNLLVMTVSSTHQTTMAALYLLFDLIEHPDSLAEIKHEILYIQSQNTSWTHRALGELRIMDSFMTETLRFHTFTQTTVNRMVMQPWTFNDGFHLPVGTQISFPTRQYSLDPVIHTDPDVFDPKRHLHKREKIDQAKYHFASTADSLIWGSGPHACPGRFLVQDSLKLIFIHLLTHYVFKYPDEGKTRPGPDMANGIMIAPDVTMPIIFKRI